MNSEPPLLALKQTNGEEAASHSSSSDFALSDC